MPQNEIKNAVEHEELKTSINSIQVHLDANALIQSNLLNNIEKGVKDTLDQTKLTNGRVTILESDMMIFRTMRKYKWLSAIIILGLLKIYDMVNIEYLFEQLLKIII